MTVSCTRCGDCCDPVWFALSPADVRQGAVTAAGTAAGADLAFAAAHWSFTGATDDVAGYAYSCDRFDPVTRLCTAHEQRPPVCRGYPWYDAAPTPLRQLPARCAFREDLRVADAAGRIPAAGMGTDPAWQGSVSCSAPVVSPERPTTAG